MSRKEREEKIIHEWFENHEVQKYTGLGTSATLLVWGKAGTGINRIQYLRFKNQLFVTGDLGDAIYSWGQIVDFKFIADCSLGYFSEKCIASETGRGYKEWDARKVREMLEYHFEDDENGEEMRKKYDESAGESALIDGEFEWLCFLRDEGYEIFGDAWWEMGLDGKEVSLRCRAHLIGLKMAMKKLEQQG